MRSQQRCPQNEGRSAGRDAFGPVHCGLLWFVSAARGFGNGVTGENYHIPRELWQRFPRASLGLLRVGLVFVGWIFGMRLILLSRFLRRGLLEPIEIDADLRRIARAAN